MRKLHIIINLQTEHTSQEVIDKLVDGLIGEVGKIDPILVEDLTDKTSQLFDLQCEKV